MLQSAEFVFIIAIFTSTDESVKSKNGVFWKNAKMPAYITPGDGL
jgi:hypothetical protein